MTENPRVGSSILSLGTKFKKDIRRKFDIFFLLKINKHLLNVFLTSAHQMYYVLMHENNAYDRR